MYCIERNPWSPNRRASPRKTHINAVNINTLDHIFVSDSSIPEASKNPEPTVIPLKKSSVSFEVIIIRYSCYPQTLFLLPVMYPKSSQLQSADDCISTPAQGCAKPPDVADSICFLISYAV